MRTIATALKVGFANNSLSADQLSELEGLYREATTALKPGTEGSGYIGKLKIRALKKYFGEIFEPSYVNPIDQSDLGRHESLEAVDRYIKRGLAQARNILALEETKRAEAYRKAEQQQRRSDRLAEAVTAAENVLASAKSELEQAMSSNRRESKQVIQKNRSGHYVRKGEGKIDNARLSAAFADYTAKLKALRAARAANTGGVK